MYKSERYLNKKKNGQHNFFGEDDYIDIKNGTICNVDPAKEEPDDEEDRNNEDKGE